MHDAKELLVLQQPAEVGSRERLKQTIGAAVKQAVGDVLKHHDWDLQQGWSLLERLGSLKGKLFMSGEPGQ